MVRNAFRSISELCEELGGHKRDSGRRCEVNLQDGERLTVEDERGAISVQGPKKSLKDVDVQGMVVERKAANSDEVRGDVMLDIGYDPKHQDTNLVNERFRVR